MRLSISKNKGVTLLELMVSIAVVSVISQLSMWFYPDFLAKNRLDNHVNLLHRNINYGRLYAIENGTYVTLCAITFRPDGSLNGFQNGTFIYCPNSNKANLEGLALSVSQTGRIRIKSTDKCQKK